MKEQCFSSKDFCVSFDVESLFTNVPLEEVIQDIANTMFDISNPFPVPDKPEAKRLTKPTFIKLLRLCTQGIFLYNDAVYQQIDGCAMGSPLGPTLANWFLGRIEKQLFIDTKITFPPQFYVRYVDDIFAVFDCKEKCNKFFDYINNLHPNLKFTVEYPNGSLPFLDVDIKLGTTIETRVHRKPTNTGVILNFNSIAPIQWKRSLILCFLNRAYIICSNKSLFLQEVKYLKAMFISNSYPSKFFDSIVNRFQRSLGSTSEVAASDVSSASLEEEKCVFLRVVYLGDPSRTLGKRLAALIRDRFGVEVKVVYTTFKVGSYFGLKSRIPALFESNLVYKYTCPRDEGTSYIGMTTSQWFVRIGQHFDPSKKSAVFTHLSQCRPCRGSEPKSHHFTVLKRLRNERDTEINEALLIRKERPTLNRQLGTYQGCSFLLRVFK